MTSTRRSLLPLPMLLPPPLPMLLPPPLPMLLPPPLPMLLPPPLPMALHEHVPPSALHSSGAAAASLPASCSMDCDTGAVHAARAAIVMNRVSIRDPPRRDHARAAPAARVRISAASVAWRASPVASAQPVATQQAMQVRAIDAG